MHNNCCNIILCVVVLLYCMDVISIDTVLRYDVQGKSYTHVCAEAGKISVRVCSCTENYFVCS